MLGKMSCHVNLCYCILYNEIKSVNIWDTPLMNMLLVKANNLYAIISQHSIQKDFLLLTDVPEILSISTIILLIWSTVTLFCSIMDGM